MTPFPLCACPDVSLHIQMMCSRFPAASITAEIVMRSARQSGDSDRISTCDARPHATRRSAITTSSGTPGHASNHVCFLIEDSGLLFTGDHLMSGSTVVILNVPLSSRVLTNCADEFV